MAAGFRSPYLLLGLAASVALPAADVGFRSPLYLLGLSAPATTPTPEPTPTPSAGGATWSDFSRDLDRNEKSKAHAQALREDAEFLEVLTIITPIIARECR